MILPTYMARIPTTYKYTFRSTNLVCCCDGLAIREEALQVQGDRRRGGRVEVAYILRVAWVVDWRDSNVIVRVLGWVFFILLPLLLFVFSFFSSSKISSCLLKVSFF